MELAVRSPPLLSSNIKDDDIHSTTGSDNSSYDLSDEERELLDKKPNQLSLEDRKRRRKIQNRLAAQESRGRKRQHVSDLEMELKRAYTTINELRNKVDELTALLHQSQPELNYNSSKILIPSNNTNIALNNNVTSGTNNILTSTMEPARALDAAPMPSPQMKLACRAMLEKNVMNHKNINNNPVLVLTPNMKNLTNIRQPLMPISINSTQTSLTSTPLLNQSSYPIQLKTPVNLMLNPIVKQNKITC